MDKEQLEKQLDRYAGFLNQDPDNINLIAEVTDLQLRLGLFREAEEILLKGLEKHPGEPGLLFRQATVAMTSGEFDRAIELYKALLETQEAPAIHYNLAYALSMTANYEAANSELEKIIDKVDMPAEALLLSARVNHHLGDLDKASQQAEQFHKINPEAADGSGVLALLHLDMMQMESAEKWADKALSQNPDSLEGLVTKGSVALEGQDEALARMQFEHAINKHPQSGRAWAGMGLTDMLGSDLETAIEDLKRAVTFMPNHIGTWHALAWCQIVTNDLDGAEASFNAAMDLDHNFGETHGGLAVIAVMRNELDKAETLAKKAVRLDPLCFSGRFAQSLLVEKQGDPEKARGMLESILSHRFSSDGPTLQQSVIKAMRQTKKRKFHH